MKMSTVVYRIKQQQNIMCFLLPVDSKPTADKMSVHKSKDRKHNGQKKKDKRTNNDLQNTMQKNLKDEKHEHH
jgi:hypothetical protein